MKENVKEQVEEVIDQLDNILIKLTVRQEEERKCNELYKIIRSLEEFIK